VAFLSLSALIMFSAAATIVANACISPRPNISGVTYSTVAQGFKPCGDPVDGPVYPGSVNSTG
jgi:uncharacterized membrane protein